MQLEEQINYRDIQIIKEEVKLSYRDDMIVYFEIEQFENLCETITKFNKIAYKINTGKSVVMYLYIYIYIYELKTAIKR